MESPWIAGAWGATVAIFAMTVATYLCRASGVVLMSRVRITPRVERALAAAGTAALTALVAGDVATADSAGATVAAATAVGGGLVVAHRGGSMSKVLRAGVPIYVLVLAVAG
jgi:uncharacterized membrane protein